MTVLGTCSYCDTSFVRTEDHFRDDIGDRCSLRTAGCKCPKRKDCHCLGKPWPDPTFCIENDPKPLYWGWDEDPFS